jgi:transposase
MGEFPRRSDGRRVFSAEFKRETVRQIVSGEKTLAETSRELTVLPQILRKWIKLVEHGGAAAVEAGEDVVPASRVRELEAQIKQLQRLIGKQAMTIEILEAAREVVKKSPHLFKGSGR